MQTNYKLMETSVYKGYKQDKIEMRGDRAEMSDFPLYLNTVAGGLDRRDQTLSLIHIYFLLFYIGGKFNVLSDWCFEHLTGIHT